MGRFSCQDRVSEGIMATAQETGCSVSRVVLTHIKRPGPAIVVQHGLLKCPSKKAGSSFFFLFFQRASLLLCSMLQVDSVFGIISCAHLSEV